MDYGKEHPNNKSASAVVKAGTEKWKSMSDAEKAPYQEMVDLTKVEYQKKLAEYQMNLAEYKKKQVEEEEKSKSAVNNEDENESQGEHGDR